MSERRCVHHKVQPAIAICSACREDICARCHRATLTGYAVCSTCERQIRRTIQTDFEAAEDVGELAAGFATTAGTALIGPRAFWASMPPLGGWFRPALFGVVGYAIGMCAQFIWSWLFRPDFEQLVAESTSGGALAGPAAAALLFLAVPFAAPLIFALHTLMLWAALRLFGARAHWRVVVRIAGYAGAGHLLQLVPPIGSFPLGWMLAMIWLMNLELLGVRRFFPELGVWQTMGAVFLPLFLLSMMQV